MPSVAEQLRTAREQHKLSIQQLAEVTKIRSDHLRALESGDYKAFAATVYIRGFVRAYASVVKVDIAKVMAQLDAELAQTEEFSQPPQLAQHPRGPVDSLMLAFSRVNWRIVLPMAGLGLLIWLAVIGVRAWKTNQQKDPLLELGPGMYEAPKTNLGELLPVPVLPERRPAQ